MRLLFMGFRGSLHCESFAYTYSLPSMPPVTCCNLLEHAAHTLHPPFGLSPTYQNSVEPSEMSNRASHSSRLQLLPFPVYHGRNENNTHKLADFRPGMSANGGKSGKITKIHSRTADSN